MAESFRQRNISGQSKGTKRKPADDAVVDDSMAKARAVGVLDILRILGGLFLLNCLLSYFITNDSVLWGWRPWFIRPAVVMRYIVCCSV